MYVDTKKIYNYLNASTNKTYAYNIAYNTQDFQYKLYIHTD